MEAGRLRDAGGRVQGGFRGTLATAASVTRKPRVLATVSQDREAHQGTATV